MSLPENFTLVVDSLGQDFSSFCDCMPQQVIWDQESIYRQILGHGFFMKAMWLYAILLFVVYEDFMRKKESNADYQLWALLSGTVTLWTIWNLGTINKIHYLTASLLVVMLSFGLNKLKTGRFL